jgi:hypothetical protein
MFVIYNRTKFHVSILNGSLVTTLKLKTLKKFAWLPYCFLYRSKVTRKNVAYFPEVCYVILGSFINFKCRSHITSIIAGGLAFKKYEVEATFSDKTFIPSVNESGRISSALNKQDVKT